MYTNFLETTYIDSAVSQGEMIEAVSESSFEYIVERLGDSYDVREDDRVVTFETSGALIWVNGYHVIIRNAGDNHVYWGVGPKGRRLTSNGRGYLPASPYTSLKSEVLADVTSHIKGDDSDIS